MKTTLMIQFGAVQILSKMNLADLTEGQSLHQPQPGGNCIRWILGHITWTYHGMLELLGQEPFLDEADYAMFQRHTDPLTDGEETPDWSRMLENWDEAQKRFIAGFEAMDESRAAEKAPYSPGGNEDETLGSLLALIAFHQTYHVGQIGLARRRVGEEGALK
jgi:uncharacterized damage-inducible protein DinB